MKKLIGPALLPFVLSTAAFAEETVYHLFADGLACQHCAMAIDKQLRKIDGVEWVDILPERGIVNVRIADGYALDEKQVATVLAEAGVTIRRIEEHPVGAGGTGDQENSL